MLNQVRKIALYGGAFDPPHKAHIQIAQNLTKLPFIDQVWLLPCGDREDKKLLLSKDNRFNLMRQIFKEHPKIKISEFEINLSKQRGKMMQTYDMLNQMKKANQNSIFYFVIGADIIPSLESWGNGKKLKLQTNFIILKRKGYKINQEQLPKYYHFMETDFQQMSSSFVKNTIWNEKLTKIQKQNLILPYLTKESIQILRQQKYI